MASKQHLEEDTAVFPKVNNEGLTNAAPFDNTGLNETESVVSGNRQQNVGVSIEQNAEPEERSSRYPVRNRKPPDRYGVDECEKGEMLRNRDITN